MKKTFSSFVLKTLGTLALVLLTMTTNLALAQSTYPPAKLLAAQWWQWVLAVPCQDTTDPTQVCLGNPLTDNGPNAGQYAAVNQRGSVWFLAGNLCAASQPNCDKPTVRTISVPAGKALFFPIVNAFDVEDGIGVGGVKVAMVHQPLQVAKGIVSSIIATANGLSCEVDGKPLPINAANLEQSTPFSVFLPADNVVGFPAGIYFPFVDSGYYVLLSPLSSGQQHTIHFTGSMIYFGTPLHEDVTYNITVQ